MRYTINDWEIQKLSNLREKFKHEHIPISNNYIYLALFVNLHKSNANSSIISAVELNLALINA